MNLLILHKAVYLKKKQQKNLLMVFFPNMSAFILQKNYNFVTALLSHLLCVQSYILVLFREHSILGLIPAHNQCNAL